MRTIIIIISILIISTHTLYSSEKNVSSSYIFNSISIENGLPSNFIDDIFKDSKGFLWISMQGGGLSRYDGYEFLRLNVNNTPLSLKSNFVRKSMEDNYDRLWVISNGGVDIIDISTMHTSPLAGNKELWNITSNTFFTSVIKDSKGAIWLLSAEKTYRIEFSQHGYIASIASTNGKADNFTSINEIDNEIWTGNSGAICKLKTEADNTITSTIVEIIPELGETNSFISTILKRDNEIWIGTENALFRYNPESHSFKHYTHIATNHRTLSQHMVTDLALTNDNDLVVATLRGLNIYNPATDDFDRVSQYIDPQTLSSDFINCLLSDKNGLWVGTEAGGINRMTKRDLPIKNYTNSPHNKNSISANAVNSIYEDVKGNLWIGTVEGGLNMKERNSNNFYHYTTEGGILTHNSVSCIEEDMNDNLWLGTWGGGINILSIKTLPAKLMQQITDDGLNYIGILKYDKINNGMWIGTNRDIFFYDIESKSLKHPISQTVTQNIAGSLGCMIDENDQLWIGTTKGLIIIDIAKFNRQQFTCDAKLLRLNSDKLNKQFLKNITCIYQSHDSSIWLGSNGYGICRLKRKGNSFASELFTDKEGIENSTILGILEDNSGVMWASSGMGIFSIDPATKNVASYTRRDGLVSNQFYWNASYKSTINNKMYFGSVGGLTELYGMPQKNDAADGKVVFTKLQIQNNTINHEKGNYIDKDIAYTNKVTLHQRDRSFAIEFSGLEYDKPGSVMYAHRLLGFDDDWITNDATRRFASYTNLRPGTYTLQVKSKGQSADWSTYISQMEIVIKPYFFRTTWFITLVILFTLASLVYFYNMKINSIKRQRKVLHKKVEERTIELKNQKKQLEKQAVELKNQNNKLFAQNEEILEQRKQLIVMSEKVKEAMADRISFFTNITHEFRTPLTLIVGPIERALKLTTNPKVAEQLHYVEKNSKNLLSLVNQLMDFRKVESDSITITMANENIINIIEDIILPFETFASERGITINTIFRVAQPYILTDKEAIRKMVTNLLSNAIKYTPNNGNISLYIGTLHDKKSTREQLSISVRDTGKGVKDEEIEHIFEQFYQSDNHERHISQSHTGTGIGLFLCKSITKLMNGTITAKNVKPNGMSFRILIPISRDLTHQPIPETVITETAHYITDAEEENTTEISKKEPTILVVEDNPDMRNYIASILSDYYNIAEAENGKEALEVLKAKHIDFIISDLMMPVMDGLELSKIVKSDISISHIPFLMLTAKTSVDAQLSGYRTGIDEYLTKPFNEELLLTRVKNIIDTRKLYQRKFSLNMSVEDLNVSKESNDDKFLRTLMDSIKKNYKNYDYEIKDLADTMGISASLLNKKMVALTGQTPGNFIRNYRLNIAYETIIQSPDDTYISEVAYEVGFNDPKYFTRCFTKQFGITPSALAKDKKPRPIM